MRPFRFDRLPRISRAEVDALRARARSSPIAAFVRGARTAGEWLGAPVRIEVGPAARPPPMIDEVLAVLLEDAAGHRAALLVEPAIAHWLIERAIGGDGADTSLGPLGDLERGILAYVVARWLAGAGSRFAVAALLTSGPALAEALGPHALVRCPLTLRLGPTAGNAAVLMPEDVRLLEPHVRLPSWARTIPIELAVVAASAELPVESVAALRPDDVIVPDGCGLRVRDGELAGRVMLTRRDGRGAWIAELRREALDAVLEIVELELCAHESAAEVMVKDSHDPLLDRMGDTPVTLVIELARLTLPLGEVAALAPGEVLRTGAPIGVHVAVRAGDRVIAEGELVDVEGELGVRVTHTAGG